MYLSGHRLRSAPSGLVAVSASRGLIESHVRSRVRALLQVHLLGRCDVVGITAAPDGRAVTRVRLLRRADHSAEELLGAGRVIDATGRLPRAPSWLRAIGLDEPDEERLPVDVA